MPEYVMADFDLKPGVMEFTYAHPVEFDNDKAAYQHIANDFRNETKRFRPSDTPCGIAIADNGEHGSLWFEAPSTMYVVFAANGLMVSVNETAEGFSVEVYLGFPSLIRHAVPFFGVRNIEKRQMDAARTMNFRFGMYDTHGDAIEAARRMADLR